MYLKRIEDAPQVAERAVIINCGTREVVWSFVALFSALRRAGMPVLLVDCESPDGSLEHFLWLMGGLEFDMVSAPLRGHGITLDWIFGAIRTDKLLLMDSDLEIRDAEILTFMRSYIDDPATFGAGFPGAGFDRRQARHLARESLFSGARLGSAGAPQGWTGSSGAGSRSVVRRADHLQRVLSVPANFEGPGACPPAVSRAQAPPHAVVVAANVLRPDAGDRVLRHRGRNAAVLEVRARTRFCGASRAVSRALRASLRRGDPCGTRSSSARRLCRNDAAAGDTAPPVDRVQLRVP